MHLDKANKIANRICEILQPNCDKVDIAGSIRRGKEEVKDIEIIALPKLVLATTDLFGDSIYYPAYSFVTCLQQFTSEVIKGNPQGRYMQIKLVGLDILLDLFLPQRNDYYRQLVIRTGNANYVRHIIASSWLKKGWVGTENGLRLMDECDGKKTSDGKMIWTCNTTTPTLPPVWNSEYEFYEFLNIEYLEPKERDY